MGHAGPNPGQWVPLISFVLGLVLTGVILTLLDVDVGAVFAGIGVASMGTAAVSACLSAVRRSTWTGSEAVGNRTLTSVEYGLTMAGLSMVVSFCGTLLWRIHMSCS